MGPQRIQQRRIHVYKSTLKKKAGWVLTHTGQLASAHHIINEYWSAGMATGYRKDVHCHFLSPRSLVFISGTLIFCTQVVLQPILFICLLACYVLSHIFSLEHSAVYISFTGELLSRPRPAYFQQCCWIIYFQVILCSRRAVIMKFMLIFISFCFPAGR